MIYDIGDRVKLSTVLRDDAGVVNNAAAMTLQVTKPDGSTTSPTVTNTGSGGIYTALVTVDLSGPWRYLWAASGAVVASEPGQFTVDPSRVLVASMEEFKAHLNRTDTSVGATAAADDLELRSHLTAATEWVEYAIGGPLSVQTFTERADLRWAYAPKRRPLVAVTSITPYFGTALSASAYVVDTDSSTIQMLYGWYGWHTIVYTAGLTVIPERVKMAGLIVAAHLWQTQNGGGGLPYPGDSDTQYVPGMGFAIPNRAKELIGPDAGFGFA